jgi:hypothetical protein
MFLALLYVGHKHWVWIELNCVKREKACFVRSSKICRSVLRSGKSKRDVRRTGRGGMTRSSNDTVVSSSAPSHRSDMARIVTKGGGDPGNGMMNSSRKIFRAWPKGDTRYLQDIDPRVVFHPYPERLSTFVNLGRPFEGAPYLQMDPQ